MFLHKYERMIYNIKLFNKNKQNIPRARQDAVRHSGARLGRVGQGASGRSEAGRRGARRAGPEGSEAWRREVVEPEDDLQFRSSEQRRQSRERILGSTNKFYSM